MTEFTTDNLLVRGTERIAYGFTDLRAFDYHPPWEGTGNWLFATDAEVRGYDMAAWREHHRHQGGMYYAPWWTRR